MRRKNGISLIVLVITIIVMIILAASVIITLSNTGIISRANEATSVTNLKQVQQLATLIWADGYSDNLEGSQLKDYVLDNMQDYIDDYTIIVTDKGVTVTNKQGGWTQTGYKVTNGVVELTVGDYIDYKSNVSGYTDANGWQVLGAENGELLILSSNYILENLKLGSNTRSEVQANYPNGYLTTIQNACEPYKNGDKATGARSIKREDIDRIINYTPNSFSLISLFLEMGLPVDELTEEEKNKFRNSDYGNEVTFTWNSNYPVFNYTLDKDTNPKVISFESDVGHRVFTWYDESDKKWRTSKLADSGTIVDDLDSTKAAKVTMTASTYMGTKLGVDTAAYSMLINNGSNFNYWLATPALSSISTGCLVYGYDVVTTGVVGALPLMDILDIIEIPGVVIAGAGDVIENTNNVRAVVSLESTLELEPNGTNSWKIK